MFACMYTCIIHAWTGLRVQKMALIPWNWIYRAEPECSS